MSKFNRLGEYLKQNLWMIFLCLIFLMVTTFVSMILIYVPTWISPKITLVDFKIGTALLGSIMGQVTLLIAISFILRRSKIDEDIQNEADALERYRHGRKH